MSLYRRKDSAYWWIKLSFKGKVIYRSSETEDKEKAQEYHDKLKASLWDQAKLGAKPEYSWMDAVEAWACEKGDKASFTTDLIIIRWLDKYLGKKLLSEIDNEMIDKIKMAKRMEKNRFGRQNSKETVNRYLNVLLAILHMAQSKGWIDRSPKAKKFAVNDIRVRWLSDQEYHSLMAALPEHLVDLVNLALNTGLRHQNLTGLKWSQIDFRDKVIRIPAGEIKNRTPLTVPLNQPAIDAIRRQIGKHQTHVFTYLGKPYKKANTVGWRNALKKAGIQDFRFHDLRHTWATWHIGSGTPAYELKELGGWNDEKMLRRYAHLSVEQLSQAASRIEPRVTNRLRLVSDDLKADSKDAANC